MCPNVTTPLILASTRLPIRSVILTTHESIISCSTNSHLSFLYCHKYPQRPPSQEYVNPALIAWLLFFFLSPFSCHGLFLLHLHRFRGPYIRRGSLSSSPGRHAAVAFTHHLFLSFPPPTPVVCGETGPPPSQGPTCRDPTVEAYGYASLVCIFSHAHFCHEPGHEDGVICGGLLALCLKKTVHNSYHVPPPQ